MLESDAPGMRKSSNKMRPPASAAIPDDVLQQLWLDNLSAEERAIAERRQEQRRKKAEETFGDSAAAAPLPPLPPQPPQKEREVLILQEDGQQVGADRCSTEHGDFEYKEPPDVWLAWVPCREWGDGKWLKCLLCNKWVQDFDCSSDLSEYYGHHGRLSNANQKDHRRKLQNIECYSELLTEEREQYHPRYPQGSSSSCASPSGENPSAGFRGVDTTAFKRLADRHWHGRSAAAGEGGPCEGSELLPAGWSKHWSDKFQQDYFHHPSFGAQWAHPGVQAGASSSKVLEQR